MTTEDPKYKIITAVSTALIIALMATYELRKQDSIERQLQAERVKMEEIHTGKHQLEKEHDEAKRQIEILKSKNRSAEQPRVAPSKR